ncbi:hypothetical protein BDY21DRAFT_13655 [Lineolata rhizophorae]|uniref:Uncharacterized protein n=1 Tax=Lineolata rhizophorae TaxID=578093 RepID=A0A6A6PEF9_9PEZI|nr:hypothetical protein BDY21DRAFT_13655 [Lineolata rhizophorae]
MPLSAAERPRARECLPSRGLNALRSPRLACNCAGPVSEPVRTLYERAGSACASPRTTRADPSRRRLLLSRERRNRSLHQTRELPCRSHVLRRRARSSAPETRLFREPPANRARRPCCPPSPAAGSGERAASSRPSPLPRAPSSRLASASPAFASLPLASARCARAARAISAALLWSGASTASTTSSGCCCRPATGLVRRNRSQTSPVPSPRPTYCAPPHACPPPTPPLLLLLPTSPVLDTRDNC